MQINFLFKLTAVVFALLTLSSVSHAADTGKPPYFKPKYAVPVTSPIVGEGKKVIATLSEKDQATLKKNGLVVNHRDDTVEGQSDLKGSITAYLIVNASRQKAFRMLTDTTTQVNYVPHLEKSVLVKRDGNVEVTEFKVGVSFITVDTQVIHQWWPEVSRLAWTLNPEFDNDLKTQIGYYNFYSIDENTALLEFGTILVTSPLVPSFVQNYMIRRDLPEALGNVKKYVDSGGTYRKDD